MNVKKKLAELGAWERKKLIGIGHNIQARIEERRELGRIEKKAFYEQAKLEAEKRGQQRAKTGGGGIFGSGGAIEDVSNRLGGFDIWGLPKKAPKHATKET